LLGRSGHDALTAAQILLRGVVDAGGDNDASVQVLSVPACPLAPPRPGWFGGWLNRLTAR
jgi:hypothetical protein